MKKALVFGAALALLAGAGFVFAQQQDPGPEHLVITDGTDKTMNPAYFPHRDHQNRLKDCGICHHGKTADGKQEKYVAGKTQHLKCNTCHNKNAGGISLEGKAAPVVGISPIQRAGHGRCHGCHKEQKSTKTPPVMLMACPTCHTKK
ncbi:MAG: cytochrome c3 family protein [Candidatus Electronema sp. VV]